MKALANLSKRFYRRLSGIFLSRYYDSIHDCPIWNFNKALSTGETKYLNKNTFENGKKGYKCWEKLFNEYMTVFGLPKPYLNYLNQMKKASKLYNQSYNMDKPWMIVKARIVENEAKKIFNIEGEKIEVTAAKLSKMIGFPINIKKVTVSEFYGYLEINNNG